MLLPLRLSSTEIRVHLLSRRYILRWRGELTTGRVNDEFRGSKRGEVPQKWTLRRWCCLGSLKKVRLTGVRVRCPLGECDYRPGGIEGTSCSSIVNNLN